MRSISLFAEDFAHEEVVSALITRLASEFKLEVRVQPVSVRGGFGTVQTELEQYVQSLFRYDQTLPDLLIVATDSNCQGIELRRKCLAETVLQIADRVIYAVPDPHVERWMLLDPKAFRRVLDRPCQLPDQKCNRGRYKQLLIDEIIAAGQTPLLGGMEYAEDIVNAMDLPRRKPKTELDQFVAELRAQFKRWQENK